MKIAATIAAIILSNFAIQSPLLDDEDLRKVQVPVAVITAFKNADPKITVFFQPYHLALLLL